MITVYVLNSLGLWIIQWVLQMIAYFFVLKKMNLRKIMCLIPFLAERELSKELFRYMRTFYRPFLMAAILCSAAWYIGPYIGMGKIFICVAVLIYGLFLMRLYWRLAKSFGKSKLFAVVMILIPPVCLLILGLGKSKYVGLELKPLKEYTKKQRVIHKTLLGLITTAELIAFVIVVGFFTLQSNPPEVLVDYLLDDFYSSTKDIDGNGEDALTRDELMGENADLVADMKTSREKFFPDHSQDESVVVMEYVIGSNLENKSGSASANIRQMKEATKRGNALTFVMEAGGSDRWFTDGIDRSTYGRYEIAGGDLRKVDDLPFNTCMAEGKNLSDFIKWTKKNYPADRYMLVMWDHGGGVPYGFGQDLINRKESDATGQGTMATSELVSAIDEAGVKFDLIGFDACLMQDIEIATALEPYTDYYLASEENEGTYGWYYTSPFGKLAADPGMSTEDFAADMLSSYDQLNTIVKDEDGKPDALATLSLVDTTLAKPAHEEFSRFLENAGEVIRDDTGAYVSIGVAGTNAYGFSDDMQIDLIDYLRILKRADVENDLGSDEDFDNLINTIQAAVVSRNADSVSGINGTAFAFPYKEISMYGDTSRELKAMSMDKERQTFDEVFSIMAVQNKKAMENKDYASVMEEIASGEGNTITSVMDTLLGQYDYTKEDWYVKGFEDYDTTEALIDIPLKETDEGYQIELPEKTWDIIADCQTMVYQKTEVEGYGEGMRYIGKDYIGGEDADGHPLVTMDGSWVHIDGQIVCYEAEPVLETEQGDVFTGKVRAELNGEDDIVLNIEWDPIEEGSDAPHTGHVTGYEIENSSNPFSFMNTKGELSLNAGDTIQFIFDTYDEEGNLISTQPAGKKIIITKQKRLEVQDAPIGDSDITFGGVLTDVYQRTMTTEQIEMHVGE